jgi:hypothetical protein
LKIEDEEEEPEPQPKADEDGWSTVGAPKKKTKKNKGDDGYGKKRGFVNFSKKF